MDLARMLVFEAALDTRTRGGGGVGGGLARKSSRYLTPVLMDFGSAGPVLYAIKSRGDVLRLSELAAQHCTMPYRAPELFDGGVTHGIDERPIDGQVDVWNLGCLLFGMMYGSSPFEVEFRRDGTIPIVECTYDEIGVKLTLTVSLSTL
jgi:serine/threonine kinase 16